MANKALSAGYDKTKAGTHINAPASPKFNYINKTKGGAILS